MVQAMNRAIAFAAPFAAATGRVDSFEVARSLIVLACAAALILARQPFLPF
jgi:hypothetical protein